MSPDPDHPARETRAVPQTGQEAAPPAGARAATAVTTPAPAGVSRSSRLGLFARRTAIDTRPLRHPAYRRLWIGQAVSTTGFQLTSIAISVQVYDLTKSSLWVGLLGPANLVPLVVFGLWGGAVADVMDRRRLLLLGSVVSWVSTLGLLAQALLGARSVMLIIGLVAVQSVGFAVTSPTRGAVIPRLLPVTLVPAANTLNFTASQTATFLGPMMAGVVIGHGGYAAAYGIDAVLFTVGLYAAVRLPPLPPRGGEAARAGLR